MNEKYFDIESVSASIVEAIIASGSTNEKLLNMLTTAILQANIDRNLVPKNYNAYESKKKREKWVNAIDRHNCEVTFWRHIVQGLEPEKMDAYFAGKDQMLIDKGFVKQVKKEAWITCYYCEREMDAAKFGGTIGQHCTMDHVIPRSKFGKSSHENIVNACNECNCLKSDMSLMRFIKRLEVMMINKTAFMQIPIELYPVMIKNASILLNQQEKNIQDGKQ